VASALPLDLCILHREGITVYAMLGEMYNVVAPCSISRMWTLPLGLLIERDCAVARDSAMNIPGEPEMPVLFSVLHPLDDLKPMSVATAASVFGDVEGGLSAAGTSEAGEAIVCDPSVAVVFASRDVPLLVTQNSSTGESSFWLLRKRRAPRGELNYERARRAPQRTAAASGAGDSTMDRSDLRAPPVAADVSSILGLSNTSANTSDFGTALFLDDDSIMSELVLERALSETQLCWQGGPRTSTLALVGDGGGCLLVCIVNVLQQRLRAYRLTDVPCDDDDDVQLRVELAFELAGVRACVPVWAVDSLLDSVPRDTPLPASSSTPTPGATAAQLLVLRADGDLMLLLGSTPLLTLPARALGDVSSLVAPGGARVSLHRGGGAGALRCTIVAAPRSTLSRRVLGALRYVLPLAALAPLLAAAATGRGVHGREICDDVGSASEEWSALTTALSRLLRGDDSVVPIATVHYVDAVADTVPEQQPDKPSDADWTFLLKYCAATPDARRSALPLPAAQAPSHVTVVRDRVLGQRVLSALHLVYEDLKLNVMTRPLLASLGDVLVGIASAIGWRAHTMHYARDGVTSALAAVVAANAADSDALSLAADESPPPSIVEWLEQRVRGDVPRFATLSALGAPGARSAAAHVSDPCHTTSLLVRLYDALAGASPAPVPSAGDDGARNTPPRAPLFLTPTSYPALRARKPSTPPRRASSTISDVRRSPFECTREAVTSAAHRVVELMADAGATSLWLDTLPLGVGLPLREMLCQCRHTPPASASSAAYALMGRADLALDTATETDSIVDRNDDDDDDDDAHEAALDGSHRRGAQSSADGALGGGGSLFSSSNVVGFGALSAVVANSLAGGATSSASGGAGTGASAAVAADAPTAANAPNGSSNSADEASDAQGSESLNAPGDLLRRLSELRFNTDRRVSEVTRLLRSTAPVTLRGVSVGVADHDAVATQQRVLRQYAQRTLALSVGRGAFTLETALPVPSEPIVRLPFALSGHVAGTRTSVALDVSALGAHHARWPNFHNGAAAGLRIARRVSSDASSPPWLIFSKPSSELTAAHAGTLLALGLHGHLSVLPLTKVYDYLSAGHEASSIALLLGLAASARGSMDVSVAKLLAVHIPALHPVSSTAVDVTPLLQTAAVMAAGLLYQVRRRVCALRCCAVCERECECVWWCRARAIDTFVR
jgi:hypothetical protein